jgi:uncharacterized protein with NRDE domain
MHPARADAMRGKTATDEGMIYIELVKIQIEHRRVNPFPWWISFALVFLIAPSVNQETLDVLTGVPFPSRTQSVNSYLLVLWARHNTARSQHILQCLTIRGENPAHRDAGPDATLLPLLWSFFPSVPVFSTLIILIFLDRCSESCRPQTTISYATKMCIVLLTTAHPSYALIVLDNRDEFICRPTSRPHWWKANNQEILSARDLQREEQGTWLGITKSGSFAVLTNYRETDTADTDHPVQGTRSRGGMVTAWLAGPVEETTQEFVHRLLDDGSVKGVGGFSLVCGKLRKRTNLAGGLEPLAIVSNRSGSPDDVPWLLEKRGVVHGLSNTSYDDPITWPKITIGQEKLLQAVKDVTEGGLGKEEMVEKLYTVLDTDTLPEQNGQGFEDYIYQLRKSVFIPPIGQDTALPDIRKTDQFVLDGSGNKPTMHDLAGEHSSSGSELREEERPDAATNNCMSGKYGTQRQTILLVDWDGHVTFFERSLWDARGNPIERGKGDMKFEFQIEGWSEESKGTNPIPLV